MASRLKNWIQQRVCRRNGNNNDDDDDDDDDDGTTTVVKRTPLPKAIIGIIFAMLVRNDPLLLLLVNYAKRMLHEC